MESDQESLMRESFLRRASDILSNQTRYEHPKDLVSVGFEHEYVVVDTNMDLVEEAVRDGIIENGKTLSTEQGKNPTDTELGASQLEAKSVKPIRLQEVGICSLADIIYDFEQDIARIANTYSTSLLRTGFYPRAPLRDDIIKRSDKPKYRVVPTFHDNHRGQHINTLLGNVETEDVSPAASISYANAVQFNLQATSIQDAVRKNNLSLMIAPFMLAMGANSRYINFRNTGYGDVRMPVWELSHDTRTETDIQQGKLLRLGLPQNYYGSLEDYFNDVLYYPFILGPDTSGSPLEDAFEIGIGLFWRDSRIKFPKENEVVVESRLVPMQPTSDHDIAFLLYFVGRLNYALNHNEPLIPIDYLRVNRQSAILNGMDGQMIYPTSNGLRQVLTTELIREELKKAKEGLNCLGMYNGIIQQSYLDILERTMELGHPSKVFYNKVCQLENGGLSRSEAIDTALKDGLVVLKQTEYDN